MSPGARPSRPASRGFPRARRGTVYLLVLSCGTLLTVVALSGLAVVRARAGGAAASLAEETARLAARSILEVAAASIAADPSGTTWRTASQHVPWMTLPLGTDSITLNLVDPDDGDLRIVREDRIGLIGTSTGTAAVQSFAVDLDPVVAPLPCLSYAVFAGGAITLVDADVTADAEIRSNVSVTALIGDVGPRCVAPLVLGLGFNGGTTILAGTLTAPPADAIDTYAARATTIPLASIASRQIKDTALGPGRNPFAGGLDDEGIYLIDCAGQDLLIEGCRIVGTLILLNPGSGSKVKGAVSWQPVSERHPALLIRGSMAFETVADDLKESSGKNYNIAGVPSDGATDTDTTDSYASVIGGTVFATGNITTKSALTLEGSLLARGTIRVDDALTIRHWLPAPPPLGFGTVTTFVPVPGSFRRVVQ